MDFHSGHPHGTTLEVEVEMEVEFEVEVESGSRQGRCCRTPTGNPSSPPPPWRGLFDQKRSFHNLKIQVFFFFFSVFSFFFHPFFFSFCFFSRFSLFLC